MPDQPDLQCPSCKLHLPELNDSVGSVAVCPNCGELVRVYRVAINAVRVYPEAEAEAMAHPAVLARLREIQAEVRSKPKCAGCNRVAPLVDGECPDCRH